MTLERKQDLSMRPKRRPVGRLLALIIASEVLILLAIFGSLYLIKAEMKPITEDQDNNAQNQLPLAILSEIDSVIAGDVPGATSWLSKRWLQREAREVLRQAGWFELAEKEPRPLPPGRQAYRIDLHLILDNRPAPALAPSAVPESLVKLLVTLQLRRLPAQGGAEVFMARASREERCSTRQQDEQAARKVLAQLIGSGIREALEQAQAEASMGVRSLAELIAEAKNKAPLRRVAALRVLGTRKEKEALRPILEALKDENHDVVLAAVGALIARKDPSALPALIDSTRNRNLEYLSQVLFAVASIGGPEADAYLDTMVFGHQNAEIRARAAEALNEMRARQHRERTAPATGAPATPAQQPTAPAAPPARAR